MADSLNRREIDLVDVRDIERGGHRQELFRLHALNHGLEPDDRLQGRPSPTWSRFRRPGFAGNSGGFWSLIREKLGFWTNFFSALSQPIHYE